LKNSSQQSALSSQPKQDQNMAKKGLRQAYDCLIELEFDVCFQQSLYAPGASARYIFDRVIAVIG
jgi:hypothetical protein